MPRATPLLLTAALLSAFVAPAAAHATPAGPAHIRGGKTVPVYSYADAIRESVWVQVPTDADQDGVRDRVAVDLVRPRTRPGVKVPVIIDASPYYACCGRGNESELKEYDENGVISKAPLFYDNYFVPRGYAFAGVDLTGTARATGCQDVGGPLEVAGGKAVIDWLNGRAPGFAADGTPVTARAWSTGKAGMIGKSWDGSVANGVAATGVRGLETIVPIGAISSWYDYQRYHGTLRSRDYPEYLQRYVSNSLDRCAAVTKSLDTESAEDTGDYNAYWKVRDYRKDAAKVRASVLIAHGVNDTNVSTRQFEQWWEALADEGVARKLYLFQTGHVDPFDMDRARWVDLLHRWFDRYLQGLRNGVDREPRAIVETSPGTYTAARDWPVPGTRPVTVKLGRGTAAYTDQGLSEAAAVADPAAEKAGRLAFRWGPLTSPLRLSGASSVTLRVRVDQPTTQLTAKLVDYGTAERVDYSRGEGVRTLATESCWGDSTAADDGCYLDVAERLVTSDYAVLTRGWKDAAHHVSLKFTTPLTAGRWYSIEVPINAYDMTVPAGHTLGLVLTQSDTRFTVAPNRGATVEVDLGRSSLTVPLSGKAKLTPVTGGADALRTGAGTGLTAGDRPEYELPR